MTSPSRQTPQPVTTIAADRTCLEGPTEHLQLSELAQMTLRHLMMVWFDFERQLTRVPLIARLERGTFTREDYHTLLLNLRQQVIEGSRWIARAASSFDRDHSELRSIVISHAREEHRDYQMLEADFEAIGGDRTEMERVTRNIGSDALHAYMMYQAGQPNPGHLLGAMWIIEGLGNTMAQRWAERIETLTGCDKLATQFLRYHAQNDGGHMDRLYEMLTTFCSSEARASAVVHSAKVVARLYALQLEEADLA